MAKSMVFGVPANGCKIGMKKEYREWERQVVMKRRYDLSRLLAASLMSVKTLKCKLWSGIVGKDAVE